VLFTGPNKHLGEGASSEEVATPKLGLNGESNPAQTLEKVVCTRHKAESPSLGDTTLGGTGLSQIAQNEVAFKIEQFKDSKKAGHCSKNCITSPAWWLVVRPNEEVHTAGAHENPVVETVFDYVEQGHGVEAEAMHENSLQDTF
jgi:hypothetical protein